MSRKKQIVGSLYDKKKYMAIYLYQHGHRPSTASREDSRTYM
jgi:hypothetical protein